MKLIQQPPKSKITFLPTQHVFNTQLQRKILIQGQIIHHNRLLILGLIIFTLILSFQIFELNQFKAKALEQQTYNQIINEELMPIN